MPRNASGTFSLVSGNPVVSGTLIDATWANNTLNDIANEMTDSLSRSGEGGMLAPLRLTDGVQATPGLGFTNEPGSGLYRAGTNEWWSVAGGVQVQQHTSNGAVTRFAAGAVGTPSLSAFGDVNTGFWFPAADTVALSTAGAEALRVNSSGVLSLVNNPTLSGGTANGVLYLNGSKAATSGSALVFDGTNLGIGTSSPGYRLDVSRPTAGVISKFISADGTNNYRMLFYTTASGAVIHHTGSNVGTLAFAVGGAEGSGTELMTLNSTGNLGIGTSSPSYRLTAIVGAGAQNIFAAQQTGVSNGYTITSDGTNLTHSWHTAGSITAQITANGSFAAGAQGALATNATNGFLYVPTCAGTPTGTPTAITGLAPIVVNTTNNKLYFYSGGAWRDAGP
jgi:hypothetical protein